MLLTVRNLPSIPIWINILLMLRNQPISGGKQFFITNMTPPHVFDVGVEEKSSALSYQLCFIGEMN